jgi:hypothetical protein
VKSALFTRSDTKEYLDPNEVTSRLIKRSAIISSENQQLLVLIQSSVTLLTGDYVEAFNFPVWGNYLDYIREIGV